MIQRTGSATDNSAAPEADGRPLDRLRVRLLRLYTGRGPVSEGFRYGLLIFDLLTVSFFIYDSLTPPMPSMIYLDMVIATVLALDFCARVFIARRRWRYLADPVTIADFVVILTLLLPLLIENWAFLRVLRAVRLLRSYRLLQDLRRRFPLVGRNQHIIVAVVDLVVFVFIITAIVFVTQHQHNPDIATYIDALYFTVATLTTTGFGDVVLVGDYGRLTAVAIMLIGFALFVRLIQAVFRPRKVHVRCPDCGLTRHDPDAVHCKHCGRVMNITTTGDPGS
ncbi:MAG: potassium channel family protein [Rhodospirillales bacterium]|nr:potassium channel family protein [Rhodospirillales bacterium]